MSQSKKQKRSHPGTTTSTSTEAFIAQHNPQKPSAKSLPAATGKSRERTISVAIPGSIVKNAQTNELKGWLAGQIARTCAIFTVSEIIVYRDPSSDHQQTSSHKPRGKYRDTDDHAQEEEDGTTFLARLLGYLETPQYLRKSLFPLHPSLRLAGLLPPLDCPHHLRRDDDSPFREGVVVQNGKGNARVKVDVGHWEPLEVESRDAVVEEGRRVTVRMPTRLGPAFGQIVSPSTPTKETSLYWGYKVRVADSLAQVFSECPYDTLGENGEAGGGYDVSIGTSERGTAIEEMVDSIQSTPFRHLLLTLGPLSGLELTIAQDPLIPLEAGEAGDLFDWWVNCVKGQGSRTVRTEEALGICLSRIWRGMEE